MSGKAKTRGEQKRAKKAQAAFAAAMAPHAKALVTADVVAIMRPALGSMKPTKEARAHAAYEEVKADTKGAKHFRRKIACLLDLLESRSTITRQQSEAGRRYDADHRLVWGTSGRDSTIPPIGGMTHETAAQAEKNVRAKERMNRVLNICGPRAFAYLRQVAAYEQPLGRQNTKAQVERYDCLKAALDAAAFVYGVPEYGR